MANSNNNQSVVRIHAIVLTNGRPETLERCICTALSSLGPRDMLTVIDDSIPIIPANVPQVAKARCSSSPKLNYLATAQAWDVIARSVPESALLWQSKTAPRDIAPLRNLSILLAAAVGAETTILIDDDIYGFNLT